MSELIQRIEDLERKARVLDGLIVEIERLDQQAKERLDDNLWGKPFSERAERSFHTLSDDLGNILKRYQPMSTQFREKVDAQGFYETTLSKYKDSTFQDEPIVSFRTYADSRISVITAQGFFIVVKENANKRFLLTPQQKGNSPPKTPSLHRPFAAFACYLKNPLSTIQPKSPLAAPSRH